VFDSPAIDVTVGDCKSLNGFLTADAPLWVKFIVALLHLFMVDIGAYNAAAISSWKEVSDRTPF
jgi:hypothetical protein